MEPSSAIHIWVVAGVVLMASELFLPGFVALFVGLACWTVALAMGLGWIASPVAILITFVIATFVYTMTLRQWMALLFGGNRYREQINEDEAAYGTLVDVQETIEGMERPGKVFYRGATWSALSTSGTLVKGEKARLLKRDNLMWTVERVE